MTSGLRQLRAYLNAADPRVEGRPTRISHPYIAVDSKSWLAQVWDDVGGIITPRVIVVDDGAMVVRSSG